MSRASPRSLVFPAAVTYMLRRARVPACFLDAAPGDLDRERCVLVDLVVEDGRIAEIVPAGALDSSPLPFLDLAGRQVWARLVDMHTHLDKGQVIPRAIPDGTLDGGANGTFEDRKRWTHEDIAHRMGFGLDCAFAHGVGAIRTHLDSLPELAPRSWAVFRELREAWKGRIELQAVGLMPLVFFDTPWGTELADLVASSGGVLGGTTDALGPYDGARDETLDRLLDTFFRIAAERGLDTDLHVDQSDDVTAFSLPRIAAAVQRNRFEGRVVCGHCVNLALQPEDVIARTIEACVAAGLTFVTLPTPMMYLQDRKPGRTPRWRGVTAAHELMAARLPVAVGGDNCRDAWFPWGDHDMLDTIQQSLRVFQLDEPIETSVAMGGPVPATIGGFTSAGRIQVGARADLIVLAARTLNEAMCRPQSDRLVLIGGRPSEAELPDYAALDPVLLPV